MARDMAAPQVQSSNIAQDGCVEGCIEYLCPDNCMQKRCPKKTIARWTTILFITCFVIAILLIIFLVPITGGCKRAPAVDLNELIIRDLSVRNVTAADATVTPWQVSSDINITVAFKSKAPVIGCYTKLGNMNASVYYGRDLISSTVSDIPLNISLKPLKRSPEVSAQLKGDRFSMTNATGAALAAELRGGNVTLKLEINTSYKGKFSRSEPRRVICNITATTPQNSESRPGTLLGKHCKDIYHDIDRNASQANLGDDFFP